MTIHVDARRPTRAVSILLSLFIALAIVVAGAILLFPPKRVITIEASGMSVDVETRALRVRDLLSALGVRLRPEDEVVPAPETLLQQGMVIHIQRARPVVLDVSGRRFVHYTRAVRVADLLAEAGILVRPEDVVWLGDKHIGLNAMLPPVVWRAASSDVMPWQREAEPVTLRIQRAVPILVTDGGVTYAIYTTAPTVGEALHQAGVTVYLGDEVRPGLGEPVSAYMRLIIRRSTPLVIHADGQTLQTRTRAHTVADVLAEEGIFLSGLDEVSPPLAAAVREGMRIKVTRVSEFVQVEDERLPYETIYVPDDNLEIDHRRVVTPGRPGIFRRRYQVRIEDGIEVGRELIDAWVAQSPITNVIAYGRKIVTRTLDTPAGTITYWRRIRMLATSYSASTAGVSPDRPWYGITRLGLPMRHGIVAVDPRVIPLGAKVYVPGYGKGLAADTGSRILGRRIDLGYDDDNLVLWNSWVDVYLLTPPPPREKINYLLPNWPRPPR